MRPWKAIFTGLIFGNVASADISDQFRTDNAVVWYKFNDTGDTLTDHGNAKFGAPLNLSRVRGTINKNMDHWEFTNASQVRSAVPAKKIYDACTPKNEVSVEILLADNESVQKRTGMDNNRAIQPLRIVTYSSGLLSRNFTIGQQYDGGNMYTATVNNQRNSNNSLREPAVSSSDAILFSDGRTAGGMQRMIFTFKPGQARIYLSDKNNHLYLHRTITNADFGGNLVWDANARFVIGNEFVSEDRFFTYNDQYETCTDATCRGNPNRYWKGRLYMVAVYCKELTAEEIFGASQVQVVTNPSFPIDANLQITPELKRAQEIYLRMTGVKTPIFNPALSQMVQRLNANDPVGAAALATADPNFLNITVRDFAARMSNRDEAVNVPMNDFTATIIGAVRDQINAQRLLYDNIVYMADPAKAAVPSNVEMDIVKSNNHYETLGNDRFDLGKVLTVAQQKVFDGRSVVNNPTPAGLLTTRQWIAAHAVAGTNRRPVEFAFREFLCTPLEKVADSTGPDNVVGRDIDRFPGGSHSKYTTTCRACHTILDGFRGAFAHFTFSNNIVKHSYVVTQAADADEEAAGFGMQQNPIYVTRKLNHNEDVFREGRVIQDDTWVNNAVYGTNASTFEWSKTSGKGLKEFGQLLANSKQFPTCMAKRVFASVCKRQAESSDDEMIRQTASEFSTTRNYNLKWLFQKIVTTKECLGGMNE